jgi:acyl carrier protein
MDFELKKPTTEDARAAARLLLETIQSLADELSPQRAPHRLALDSRLDHDAALDSLGRAELIARLEHAFEVGLPDDTLLAQTPRELLGAIFE